MKVYVLIYTVYVLYIYGICNEFDSLLTVVTTIVYYTILNVIKPIPPFRIGVELPFLFLLCSDVSKNEFSCILTSMEHVIRRSELLLTLFHTVGLDR